MDILASIKKVILDNEEEMIAFRRELHKNPELSMQEVETTKKIARELDKLNIEYKITKPSGIIAWIDGDLPGKTILLRADIDALPIKEANQIDYKSKNDGVMHACGHDTHAAMLICAAKALLAIRSQLKGKVELVFQPGEEIGKGAPCMIDQGVLDGVDSIFGIHINSAWDKGKVYCRPGEMMAANDIVKIKFKGKAGHGARPNEGIDSIVMAASYIMNIQTVVTREISALDSVVITFGKLSAGTAMNILAEEAVLEGTVRTFNPEVQGKVQAAIKRYAEQIADMYRGEVEIDYTMATPSLINDKKCAALLHKTAREIFGDNCIDQEGKKTGSEDFAFYMSGENAVPGVFCFVGARSDDENTHFNHHTNRFNIDESALKNGALLHALYAYRYLDQN